MAPIIGTARPQGTRLADEKTHAIPGRAHPRWCLDDCDLGDGVHSHHGPAHELDTADEQNWLELRAERFDRPGAIGDSLVVLTVNGGDPIELTTDDLQRLSGLLEQVRREREDAP